MNSCGSCNDPSSLRSWDNSTYASNIVTVNRDSFSASVIKKAASFF